MRQSKVIDGGVAALHEDLLQWDSVVPGMVENADGASVQRLKAQDGSRRPSLQAPPRSIPCRERRISTV